MLGAPLTDGLKTALSFLGFFEPSCRCVVNLFPALATKTSDTGAVRQSYRAHPIPFRFWRFVEHYRDLRVIEHAVARTMDKDAHSPKPSGMV